MEERASKENEGGETSISYTRRRLFSLLLPFLRSPVFTNASPTSSPRLAPPAYLPPAWPVYHGTEIAAEGTEEEGEGKRGRPDTKSPGSVLWGAPVTNNKLWAITSTVRQDFSAAQPFAILQRFLSGTPCSVGRNGGPLSFRFS